MSATLAGRPSAVIATAPAREMRCPTCDRFLGESNAPYGTARLKCPVCNGWKKVTLGTGRLVRPCYSRRQATMRGKRSLTGNGPNGSPGRSVCYVSDSQDAFNAYRVDYQRPNQNGRYRHQRRRIHRTGDPIGVHRDGAYIRGKRGRNDTQVSMTVATSRSYMLPAALCPWQYMKIVSGSSEDADRSLVIQFKS